MNCFKETKGKKKKEKRIQICISAKCFVSRICERQLGIHKDSELQKRAGKWNCLIDSKQHGEVGGKPTGENEELDWISLLGSITPTVVSEGQENGNVHFLVIKIITVAFLLVSLLVSLCERKP